MQENVKAEIIVSGFVQGVFFRAFVREKAKALGLKGFVENLDSGYDVKVVVAGDKKKIEELIGLLKIGPPKAKVKSIKISFFSFKENEFNDFKIKY